ncbi:glycosyltransferase [Sphingomonas abietis]|uniref:Glycosyltransferase n=1 Tax=Sphingomonas abietis TaxID=3012344 RepID=A0ABY7NQ44_9SPHN|nr:glycosyltransferase [Sphingomonas abietis]WBO22738.1 glycosyltransferase [Sphingomonas abietis]
MRLIKSWWGNISAQLRFNPRSNGVRVHRSTAVHIRAGNIARGQQDWSRAASAYRRALTSEPHLQHLWVQLAHMEKEAGEIDRATCAYEEAARLKRDDPEPLLQLGHMAKAWRQPADAAGYFVAALQRDRTNLQAISELVRLMPDRDEVDPDLWTAVLDVLEINPAEVEADDTGQLPREAMVFDVTDLLAFFGQRRLPTGIQRVQIEVSLACLEERFDPQPVFCVYASARRGWLKLPRDHFDALCRLARQSDDIEDPAWIAQLDQMYRKIAVARTIRFSPGTVLVNLGTSWSDRNYLLDVRNIRARDGMVYVPLVFDLIPLIGPHWFMQSLVRDYRAWFGSLLHSADGCLTISEATREDLLDKSAEWNVPMPRESVPVVRLDGDFCQVAADPESLRAYGLEAQRYVLFVSTLEPRKNHRGAFEAWLALADTLGEAAMPRLVCVGGRGWLNEHLHEMLRDRPVLQRLVLILHGIPDDTLATLYQHCLFALYPSFYEGWGLPVSEALSYGKVPAISRVSSLPEAGGPYARYFDPNMVADIAKTVRTLLNAATRQAAEAAIRQDYAPRTWHRIAQDVVAKASMVASRVQDTLPCLDDAGTWSLALFHQIETSDQAPVSQQGEALRHGSCWLSPGITGCRIRGDDAALWFCWGGTGNAVLHIHFAVTPGFARVRVGINGQHQEYQVEPGIPLIISSALQDGPVTLRIPIVPTAGEIVVEKMVITRPPRA